MSEDSKPSWIEGEDLAKLGEVEDHECECEGDPVVRYASGWHFWDETWSKVHGPYQEEGEARLALAAYANSLHDSLVIVVERYECQCGDCLPWFVAIYENGVKQGYVCQCESEQLANEMLEKLRKIARELAAEQMN